MKPPYFAGKQQRGKKWGEKLVPLYLRVPVEFKQALEEFAQRQPTSPAVSEVVKETIYQAYPDVKKRANQLNRERTKNGKKYIDGIKRTGF
ncbi:hypothetical protein ACFZAD_24490 [Streptomyces iakyrus]|uniref:hypothetical protein n=1 Tax=Streptomyces iakyrus TaxID=68219 RepID=UPI0036EF334C